MLELNINEIVKITKGKLYGNANINSFNSVVTDTRKVSSGDVFLAFKGEYFNANKHIQDAFLKDASLCIVDELHYDVDNLPYNKSIIVVDNVERALGELAQYYIKKVNVKVIGVTGSCGKTSTKDMIAAALSVKYKVLKTIGNFNNHIGLPLTILGLDSSFDIAVLEMGMSNAKEIEYLTKIAKPDISVITNIGFSHIENLGTQENILNAKMECTTYFNKDSVLIVNGDDKMLRPISSEDYSVVKVGTCDSFNFCARNIELNSLTSSFDVIHNNINQSCKINMPGHHNVINFLLSVAVASEFGISISEAEEGLKNIEKTSMRLELKEVRDYLLINDCYNASPDSMKSALDVQVNLGEKRNIAVLGPMFELGDLANKCHYELGKYILTKNIDMVFTTGEFTSEYKRALGDKCIYFDTKEDLIKHLKKYIQAGDSILIKASRGAHFEEIFNSLTDV